MCNSSKKSQAAMLALAAIYGGSLWQGMAATPSANPKLKTLWSFNGSTSSASSLAPGNNGELYGTTPLDGPYFSGTVFELKPPKRLGGAWTKTVIYNFMGGNDGNYPNILPMTPGGALYGTSGGGPVSSVCTFG